MNSTLPWIKVGELAEAFHDNNALPPTAELVGRTLTLYFEDGRSIEHRFQSKDRLVWKLHSADDKAETVREETYSATKVRGGIYLVDFIKHLEPGTAVTLVLDLDRGIFTAVVGQLPTEAESRQPLLHRVEGGEELTSVRATFLSGSVDKPFNSQTPRHEVTDDMIGRRVEYTYSPTERYEHVYLNSNFYSWHCLQGAEKGLADTDRCHYYKLADKLYLFVWREKIIPTLGVVVVDFDSLQSNGKIFGYQGYDFGALSNFRVGAKARLLNVTRRGESRC